MKILTIVGARPQFIKAAVVSQHLRRLGVEEKIIHTGQHYDARMSAVFFEQLHIPSPHYHLGIETRDNATAVAATLEAIHPILTAEKPDAVLVYGDTNATAGGALAAAYANVPLAHVEAGLRSYNTAMAEETNRVITDRLSSALFCPTVQAVKNLEQEGFIHLPGKSILFVGDVQFDLMLQCRDHIAPPSDFPLSTSEPFLVCTLHRAENVDVPDRLHRIANALKALHRHIPVVMPLHPRTKKRLTAHGISLPCYVIEPTDYSAMQWLLHHAYGVITDSGGVQKEAFFHRKPCVVWRTETEWTELIACGAAALSEPEAAETLAVMDRLRITLPHCPDDLFGEGNAGQKIADYLSA